MLFRSDDGGSWRARPVRGRPAALGEHVVERAQGVRRQAAHFLAELGREPLRERLADVAGCSKEEIAINRNASESIETIIFGLNLNKGDEVILCKQDYPNMIHAWKQREMRDGIKLVWLSFDLPVDDDDEIVKRYTDAFTAQTRVVHITHIINWTGQIMPVKRIAQAAHKNNIEVLCDGAHSFTHIDYKIPDLDCDYFGTSLHKWMCAPLGTGMMYIKKEKIKSIWPLLANDKPDSDDIRKFEVLGTRNFASEQAIGNAINFHNMIGAARKAERLRYLKNYWCQKVKSLDGLRFNTTLDYKKSCAICNVSMDGLDTGAFEAALFSKHKIHTSPINWENIHGVRITPNVYTSLKDLDTLVLALNEIATTKK